MKIQACNFRKTWFRDARVKIRLDAVGCDIRMLPVFLIALTYVLGAQKQANKRSITGVAFS